MTSQEWKTRLRDDETEVWACVIRIRHMWPYRKCDPEVVEGLVAQLVEAAETHHRHEREAFELLAAAGVAS